MLISPLAVVVLAAGQGKRFHSDMPKVLHRMNGRTLIHHVISVVQSLGEVERLVVVVGRNADAVRTEVARHAPTAICVEQPEPLGTADAVKCALPLLDGFDGVLVVLPGDTPLVSARSLISLIAYHADSSAAVSLLTARVDDPTGYGRVIQAANGHVTIVEDADATDAQKSVDDISSGFWCFDISRLSDALGRIDASNEQGEYYLPDAAMAIGAGGGIVTLQIEDPDEVRGINDREQLADAAAVARRRTISLLAAAGVTFEDPATTYVDADVEIGPDTIVRPNTFLEGRTVIGARCSIGPSTRIVDSVVDDDAEVTFSVVREAKIGSGAQVGPFASVRPGTTLGPRSKVGTFVEVKASSIGEGSKVPHLSYIGDAELGADVNIGAGTITCNYDGETGIKSKTVIGDGVLVGSDTMLVAPVNLADDSVTGAGSVVTKDVAEGDVVVGSPARPVRRRRPR
ncbi:MAG TPA: bifunctional UDP-N-acetylglucosamine diphosphorylase/glucosamine-1-phosphate N-acetyltransferase GlmU [Actinomycetota bacterium]|nr:bifunctional UDP-N-acetylglucosamine diphosphorylase/glucosamine-1-phosphate N-acetyltransferase GlmU [Actinomycetota bacterium]